MDLLFHPIVEATWSIQLLDKEVQLCMLTFAKRITWRSWLDSCEINGLKKNSQKFPSWHPKDGSKSYMSRATRVKPKPPRNPKLTSISLRHSSGADVTTTISARQFKFCFFFGVQIKFMANLSRHLFVMVRFHALAVLVYFRLQLFFISYSQPMPFSRSFPIRTSTWLSQNLVLVVCFMYRIAETRYATPQTRSHSVSSLL